MLEPKDPFRYCPRCASELAAMDDHGTARLACPRCSFIHYRNPVPAAGVILVEAGRVLMVKRRFAPRAGAWCLPAGFMESGETPERTAMRELEEETGIVAILTGLFGVYAGFDDPRVRTILILYTAQRTGGTLRAGDDAVDARFYSLARPPRPIAFESHRRALAERRAQEPKRRRSRKK